MHVCLWVCSYVSPDTVISRSVCVYCTSNVVIILVKHANPALIYDICRQNQRWRRARKSLITGSFIELCSTYSGHYELHTALLMTRVYLGMPVGGAADEVAPNVSLCVISVSHTHCSPSLSHSAGVMWAYLCVSVCVFSSWWLMQGKSRWVKTTSVRCSVWEVIIYSLCTKLPSNLALFTTTL